MPYLFGLLVMVNLALFGYFWLVSNDDKTGALNEVRASIEKPIPFVNNSHNIPPSIINQGMNEK